MAILYIVAIAASPIAALFLYRKFYAHQYFKKLGIPGPQPHWLFGNLLEVWATPTKHQVLLEWSRKYGPFVGYYEGGRPILLTSSIDAVEQICVKQFSNFTGRYSGSPMGPDPDVDDDKQISRTNVVFSKGENWKRLRMITNSSFTTGKLKSYMPYILKSQEDFIAVLNKKAATKQSFDILAIFQQLTFDVISEICYGVSLDALKTDGNTPILQGLKDFVIVAKETTAPIKPLMIFNEINYPGVRLLKWISETFKVGPLGSMVAVSEICHKVIKQRQQNPQMRRNDLLQELIDGSELSERPETKYGRPMNEEEVVVQAFAFFFGGTDTTSLSLGFAAYLLAQHRDIQQKLYEHVKDLPLTYESLLQSPYLHQVSQEVFRLYPVANLTLNRICTDDTVLCGISIQKGLIVQVNVPAIHHDPEFWGPVPTDQFQPERWAENYLEVHPRPDSAFLTFGYGPRICIGMRLAYLEFKLALTTLVQNFEILENDSGGYRGGLPIQSGLFISPANGVHVRLQRRK